MNNHHEKWMATIIWVALLIALMVTSLYAWQTTATNSILNVNNPIWQGIRDTPNDDTRLVDWLSLIFNGGVAVLMVLSWLRFADMSSDLFKAFAEGEAPFARMLIYPLTYAEDNDENETNPDEAENSVLGGLIRNLGFTWVLIILIPPVMSILTKVLE